MLLPCGCMEREPGLCRVRKASPLRESVLNPRNIARTLEHNQESKVPSVWKDIAKGKIALRRSVPDASGNNAESTGNLEKGRHRPKRKLGETQHTLHICLPAAPIQGLCPFKL